MDLSSSVLLLFLLGWTGRASGTVSKIAELMSQRMSGRTFIPWRLDKGRGSQLQMDDVRARHPMVVESAEILVAPPLWSLTRTIINSASSQKP
jgi:hypothetical protein